MKHAIYTTYMKQVNLTFTNNLQKKEILRYFHSDNRQLLGFILLGVELYETNKT